MHLNVQADVRARLASALAPVEVRITVRDPRPEEIVTVSREGGRRENGLIDRAGIGIYCRAATEERACELAYEVAAAMEGMPFSGGYARVEMDSMESDPDPDTGEPRWYLSYTVACFQPNEKKEA